MYGEGCRKDMRIDSSTRAWRGDGGRILSLMVSMHFSPVVVTLYHPSTTTVNCDCGGNNTGEEGEVGVDRFSELFGFSSGRDVADFAIRRFFLEDISEVLDGVYVVGRAQFCTLELY